MREIVLTYQTTEVAGKIDFTGAKMSFGRGSDADFRFDDDGLSRLNSTIYSEGKQLWIVDENSTNGTFVNGEKVRTSGTPLLDGDIITIGNFTKLKVSIDEKDRSPKSNNASAEIVSNQTSSSLSMVKVLAISAIAIAFFIISISGIVIAYKVLEKEEPVIVRRDTDNEPDDLREKNESSASETPTPKITAKSDNQNKPSVGDKGSLTDSPEANQQKSNVNLTNGKKYLDLSDSEQRAYIESRAQKVAAMIGNRVSGEIPALAIDKIKGFLDGYAKRTNVSRMNGCRFGDNLQATYERAGKNAPFIIHAFNQEGVDPQIGMYLAMIESEHCVCLQSPTGPLGMFQFTKATAAAYGLQVFAGASPSNPDERCKPEPAALAAAKYMKFLTGRYGTGPSSVPLAIGSYNSGEGGLSTNLKTALESNEGLPRDFWTLIANGEKLSKQFQAENFKYVPKFFAAAIIGENPADFGLSTQPLSTYTKE